MPNNTISKSENYVGVAASATPISNVTIDSILPSLLLVVGVVTGIITIASSLNKGQEDKINRLMHKIDELDARLDSVNISILALNEKYVTKHELSATENRIESYFNSNKDLLIRLDNKIDKFVISCKTN